jgi:tetratricopeptide (TPR) repeat protein
VTAQAWPAVWERPAADQEAREKQAERELSRLLPLTQAERLEKIHRSSRRFRGLELAHRLLEEAKKGMPERRQETFDLAEVAEQVLLRSPMAPGYFDALARASAYRANALRASGKLAEADKRMATARSLIRHQDVTATLVVAEVDAMEGVLRKDQRRFQEAEDLLTRSAVLFELAGERREAARPLMALGAMYHHRQETAKAIETTKAALASLNAVREPRLYLSARFHLALFLAESGRLEAALEILAADAALYEKRLAELICEIFSVEDMHREAAAALLLFQEAARREMLTAERSEEMVRYLQRAQGNPELRFAQEGGEDAVE